MGGQVNPGQLVKVSVSNPRWWINSATGEATLRCPGKMFAATLIEIVGRYALVKQEGKRVPRKVLASNLKPLERLYNQGDRVTYIRQRDPTMTPRVDGSVPYRQSVDEFEAIFLHHVGEKSAKVNIKGKEITVLLRQLKAAPAMAEV